ncbi:MAG TPA: hypothetical protein VHO23_02935 [Candidatus Paceibacterota bacterium]|nr:hypothetical protein [Candidatus Paceibacterota bacterium]
MPDERTYPILSPYVRFFRDEDEAARLERLRFHLESGDYFPFIATIIGSLKEAAAECGDQAALALAGVMQRDLIHLHERYDITPKAEPIAYEKRAVVRFTDEPTRNHQSRDTRSA